MGLLPSVCHLVQSELGGTAVHLVTVLTFKAPGPGVSEQVKAELCVVAEGLATLLTLVRLLPGVDALVAEQVGGAHEGLPTLLALEALLVSVNSLVKTELGIRWEGLSALLTLVGLLPQVQLLVVTELGGRVEGLPTLLTLVRPLTPLSALRFAGVRATRKGTVLSLTAFPALLSSLTPSRVWRAAKALPSLWMRTGLRLTVSLLTVTGRRLAHGRFVAFLTPAGFSSRVSLPVSCALGGTRPFSRGFCSLTQVSLLTDMSTLHLARDFSVTSGPAVLKARAGMVFCHLLLQHFNFGTVLWKEVLGFCPRLPICKTVRKWKVSHTSEGASSEVTAITGIEGGRV